MKKLEMLIYENWNHFIPTGKSWANGLQRNNHSVAVPAAGTIKTGFFKIDELMKFDVIVDFEFDSFDYVEHLNELSEYKKKYPETIIVAIVLKYKNEYSNFNGVIDYWASLVSEYPSEKIKFEENNLKYIYVPLAGDELLFNKLETPFINFDFSFVGQFGGHGHGYRGEDWYLYPLLNMANLTNYVAGFTYKQYQAKYLQHSNLNVVYNSAKINLNFHYDVEKGEVDDRFDFNSRTFEIALSGNFQLCDHPLCKNIFGESFVIASKENWISTFMKYLDNSTERQRIAFEVQKIALEKHTWKVRMNEFLKLIGSPQDE